MSKVTLEMNGNIHTLAMSVNLKWLAVLALVVICLGAAPGVDAVHLTDHRFTVWGEVKYEDGAPVQGATINFLGGNETSIGQTKTDDEGRYQAILHLHNQDLGKVFDMRVGDETRKVKVLFDPADANTERGVRQDFVVKR